ncbi:hypothetical protein GCM10012275_26900 [Longimycelium tulufanense]|uniref:Uncharacterized protein n=1 Tax=Longimycelium tulufanense TaxID=907463 RepID=A0A8J3C8F5_9PSEU|nr:hypothetical protein [Longimycelium tulufanense]GGM54403.1 hypothetical protein GCM10012275_26900 [Longimycelium tulufanense]
MAAAAPSRKHRHGKHRKPRANSHARHIQRVVTATTAMAILFPTAQSALAAPPTKPPATAGDYDSIFPPFHEILDPTKRQIPKEVTIPKIVYRIDTRSPEEIFNQGFQIPGTGTNNSVLDHIWGESTKSAKGPKAGTTNLVSTTSDLNEVAIQWQAGQFELAPGKRPWIYVIRPDENFYSVRLTLEKILKDGSPTEQASAREALKKVGYHYEWDAHGGIKPKQVHSAFQIDVVNGKLKHLKDTVTINKDFDRATAPNANPKPFDAGAVSRPDTPGADKPSPGTPGGPGCAPSTSGRAKRSIDPCEKPGEEQPGEAGKPEGEKPGVPPRGISPEWRQAAVEVAESALRQSLEKKLTAEQAHRVASRAGTIVLNKLAKGATVQEAKDAGARAATDYIAKLAPKPPAPTPPEAGKPTPPGPGTEKPGPEVGKPTPPKPEGVNPGETAREARVNAIFEDLAARYGLKLAAKDGTALSPRDIAARIKGYARLSPEAKAKLRGNLSRAGSVAKGGLVVAGVGLWAKGVADTFGSDDATSWDKAAAVTSIVPFVGCGVSTAADVQQTEFDPEKTGKCVGSDALLFTPLWPAAVAGGVADFFTQQWKESQIPSLTRFEETRKQAWDKHLAKTGGIAARQDAAAKAALQAYEAEKAIVLHNAAEELAKKHEELDAKRQQATTDRERQWIDLEKQTWKDRGDQQVNSKLRDIRSKLEKTVFKAFLEEEAKAFNERFITDAVDIEQWKTEKWGASVGGPSMSREEREKALKVYADNLRSTAAYGSKRLTVVSENDAWNGEVKIRRALRAAGPAQKSPFSRTGAPQAAPVGQGS